MQEDSSSVKDPQNPFQLQKELLKKSNPIVFSSDFS